MRNLLGELRAITGASCGINVGVEESDDEGVEHFVGDLKI